MIGVGNLTSTVRFPSLPYFSGLVVTGEILITAVQ
jgi:hypothetical protein